MKIALIGCGSMGSAFAEGSKGQYTWICYDRSPQKSQALAKRVQGKSTDSLQVALQEADAVLLAVKPKDINSLIKSLLSISVDGKIILSLIAGVSTGYLKKHFPKAYIVRLMPNLGVVCQKGVIGLIRDPQMPSAVHQSVECLARCLGETIWIKEDQIDAFLAMSSSGIGFIFAIMEAFIDEGVRWGFSEQLAQKLVVDTLEGAVALIKSSSDTPAQWKLRVASPGGTTQAGLKAMQEAQVKEGIEKTLRACHERSIQITKEIDLLRN